MLGKLIKNEFKANIHSIGLIYLVAAVAVAFMAGAYIFKITWISAVATVVLIISGVLAVFVTFILVVFTFKNSLYGNQGYLSFTLPVTSGQLLAAKTIASFIWMILSYIMALGIYVGVFLYANAMIGENIKTAFRFLIQMFEGLPSAGTIKLVIVMFALMVFIRLIVLIAQLFFAITLSNTRSMQKLGGLGSVVIFFVVFIVMTVAGTLLAQYVPIGFVLTSDGLVLSTSSTMANPDGMTFGIAGTLFNIISSIVLFITTSRIMNTTVNIK